MSSFKSFQQFVIVFLLSSFVALFLLNWSQPVYSNTVSELENEINKKTEELNKKKSVLSDIEKKIAEISGSNYSLAEKINMLNKEISTLQVQIDARNAEIEEKLRLIEEKQDLLAKKKELLDMVSTELYMKSRHDSGQFIFSFSNLDTLLQNLFVKKSAIMILREDIEEINGEFTSLSETKGALEAEKSELDAQKKDLDDSNALLIAEKNKIQKELNAQLATKKSVSGSISELLKELTTLQTALVNARAGGTVVNIDSVPSGSTDLGSLKSFVDKAPSGSYGIFAFGAYTHRNGMSQWGARARANEGQTFQQILNAYYPGKEMRTGNVTIGVVNQAIMTNITTTAYGTLNFEDDYLMRLQEVPESWPMAVLKAQAIAARTYAINYTQNGGKTICVTESCQVVGPSQKTGAWRTAVLETRGMVLTDGAGKPFSTQYAAVHGGWGNQMGWDTTDGSGSGDWMARAWDSKSGVSWFYKSWYRSGYTSGSTVSAESCNRNPWLNREEMSDILMYICFGRE
jgi:peptidoglycan hydrolase CwlO-like protein